MHKVEWYGIRIEFKIEYFRDFYSNSTRSLAIVKGSTKSAKFLVRIASQNSDHNRCLLNYLRFCLIVNRENCSTCLVFSCGGGKLLFYSILSTLLVLS